MNAPYIHRRLKSQNVEAIMFGCSVTGLLGLCVGAFRGGNSAISNVGGVCSVIVIFYALLLSVGTALEFKFWRWWAKDRIQLTDRHHKFTKIDTIDEKRLWFGLSDEAQEWVNTNCRGRVVVVPEMDPMWLRVVAFSDPDDAFHFKMRWL